MGNGNGKVRYVTQQQLDELRQEMERSLVATGKKVALVVAADVLDQFADQIAKGKLETDSEAERRGAAIAIESIVAKARYTAGVLRA
jgi:hypothetical protein